MTDHLFGIHWAAWHNIYYLAPVAVTIAVLLFMRWRRHTQYIAAMAAPEHRPRMVHHASMLRRATKVALYGIATVCIMIALLRPQWGRSEQTVTQEGRDVVIALDVSRSMLVQDITPDRLTFAKQKVQDILNQLHAERVALVIFAGDAVVQCPLTRDKNAFHLFLDGITSQTISSGTTAIERALACSASVFANRGVGNRHRLLIMVTDTEDFASQPERMRQLLRDEQLQLFVLSVGTPEGGPIPEYDYHGTHTGYKRDYQGNVAISRCNTHLAHDLADACDGVYIQSRTDNCDVQRVQQWVSYFEKKASEEVYHTGYAERYYLYTIPALVALALEWLI